MLPHTRFLVPCLLLLAALAAAFQPAPRPLAAARPDRRTGRWSRSSPPLFMSESAPEDSANTAATIDPMAAAMETMDAETRRAMEKAKRADELRAQEVFMKKSTGRHKCTNCDWLYDQEKGDAMMIGGMVQPGTAFTELPSNWRCPVCRASKDSFLEVVEEIPGFEVNQNYGFGTNSWSAGQKNLAIFGGLGLFFLLFLSGYALS